MAVGGGDQYIQLAFLRRTRPAELAELTVVRTGKKEQSISNSREGRPDNQCLPELNTFYSWTEGNNLPRA